jgi:hypothetical protein
VRDADIAKGLETEHPIVQIDGMLFQGTYEESVGTQLFFKPSEAFDARQDYLASSTKRLVFRRIKAKPL